MVRLGRAVRKSSTVGFVVALIVAAVPVEAASQNDAESGGDAGDTFADATPVELGRSYAGRLDRAAGDRHDYYRFFLLEGAFATVVVSTSAATVDPITILDPNGVPLDASTRVFGAEASATGLTEIRVSVARALVAGPYRLHLQAETFNLGAYGLCFNPCEGVKNDPIDLIFGGSLRHPRTRVLLVPPVHGDLGNPLGPTVLDYLDATVRGIHDWERAIDAFAAEFPQYGYLQEIDVDVEVFDGPQLVNPAGYDVVIAYVESSGPVFRGLAADFAPGFTQSRIDNLGLGNAAHFSGRTILLSLFAYSPRAGQVLADYPEVTDLEIVTMHEFGHTFGLGHTERWTADFGPDIMNSPAPFIYGDGSPVGDGGERTGMKCLSSLDLYGLAVLYRWLPTGVWVGSGGTADLPAGIPYQWYC